MKKLLIVQLDGPYFLFETLQVLERNRNSLKDYQTTILINPDSLKSLGGLVPAINGVTTDKESVSSESYDISVNLSLDESSWPFHAEIKSPLKIGPQLKNGQLLIADTWSSHLLTLKARAPFLTYHLQHIYQNILGFKSIKPQTKPSKIINRIAYAMTSGEVFPGVEQENLIHAISSRYTGVQIVDISEIDPITDLSKTLYIGPASLPAVQICEYGARGIFLGSHFQGFNLLPSGGGHFFISSRGEKFTSAAIEKIIHSLISYDMRVSDSPLSIYVTDDENAFGGYFQSLNNSDDNYPFYQAHLVLWNYVLNLLDTNLEITKCTNTQVELLQRNKATLVKLIRLYDYALSSVDVIHQQSKLENADVQKIQGHLANLREIDQLTNQISQTNSLLRPFLDYYRMRRGQNFGTNLSEQSQNSFFAYSEEHQAMQALDELFSVTLRKNEVNL